MRNKKTAKKAKALLLPIFVLLGISLALIPWKIENYRSLGLNVAFGGAATAGGAGPSGPGAGDGDAGAGVGKDDNGADGKDGTADGAAAAGAAATAAQGQANTADAAAATASMGPAPGGAFGLSGPNANATGYGTTSTSTADTGVAGSFGPAGPAVSATTTTSGYSVGYSHTSTDGTDTGDGYGHTTTEAAPGKAADDSLGGYTNGAPNAGPVGAGDTMSAVEGYNPSTGQTVNGEPTGSFFGGVVAGFKNISAAIDNSAFGQFMDAHFSPDTVAAQNPATVAMAVVGVTPNMVFSGIQAEAESLGPSPEAVLGKFSELETTAVDGYKAVDGWITNPFSTVVAHNPGELTGVAGEVAALGITPAVPANLPGYSYIGAGINSLAFSDGFTVAKITANEQTAAALGKYTNMVASEFSSVPAVSVQGDMLTQGFVKGQQIDALSPAAQAVAEQNAFGQITAARQVFGMTFDTAMPGTYAQIDTNLKNFMFTPEGVITGWFDPVAVTVTNPQPAAVVDEWWK